MSERKKILILGNGFDLAHFLPTKYEHFITAMRAVEDADLNEHLLFDNVFHNLLTDGDFFLNRTKEMYKTEEVEVSVEDLNILKEKLSNNGWFQYFKDYLDSGIDTWIDFENEIKNVLDIVCSVLESNSDKNEIIDKNYYRKGIAVIDEKFFDSFNVNKSHYLNILIKFNVLLETYVVDNRDGFIEVGKDEFDSISIGNIFEQASSDKGIYSKSKRIRLESHFAKRYKGETTGIHTYKVIKKINEDLLIFIDIFSTYIEFIESLVPRNILKAPKVLKYLDDIYSFNYSSTTSRLYDREHSNFLHGKVGGNNIVLGISDLENKLLIDEKAYGFVKYYQKLVNNTNYNFLLENKNLKAIEEGMHRGSLYWNLPPYEIYIWGHSLDSSDSDYIKEIFSFNKGVNPSVY
ncbi:AbiH family protein, partial [Psychrobacter sp. AOP7-A1-24]|uniref:AbiH family protein n=1 Tax=Psychrobacter sp. AOP7-A1-24 TaxID=3457646 RepID=UPI00402BD748